MYALNERTGDWYARSCPKKLAQSSIALERVGVFSKYILDKTTLHGGLGKLASVLNPINFAKVTILREEQGLLRSAKRAASHIASAYVDDWK